MLITIGYPAVVLAGKPIGTTKLIADGLTEYIPQAAPRIDTETPFNSTGSAGANFNSDALAVDADAGATLALEVITASSPAASPGAMKGVGLPVGLGDGVGLPLATGTATGIILAPVNREIVAVESVVAVGSN